MPTNPRREGHNVRVTPRRRARTALLSSLLVPALLLSGCGADDEAKPTAEPSLDLPKGDVEVPDGITLTKAGTELKFREPAVVAYEPNTTRNSVLSLAVDSVQAGRIADFADYQMDARTRKSRPYYVRYTVKNVGTGDLSRAAVPLLAVDNRNTLIQPSTFNNTFAKCPSLPLPAAFTGGKSFQGCLVYLVPDAGTLVQMSYRPLQAFEPITWQGTITPAVTKKADGKGKSGTKKKAKP
ncbi:MAG TPA: hypothetical protein VK903_10890 [Propionicimonas sp.]|nr:hypothetical protein [Propionicimonas sp.]